MGEHVAIATGAEPREPGVWRLCVDTGGTFNDCIAVAPDGSTKRAKVLSSGALRGRVIRAGHREYTSRVHIKEQWGDWEPGQFVGYSLRVLGSDHPAIRVSAALKRHDDAELLLSDSVRLASGELIEVSSGEPAPILAARLITKTPLNKPLPPIALRLATTRGTNALLERRAGPVAFFVTAGFADLLEIGTQQRPDIFALNIVKPRPLYDVVVEVPERVAVDGSVLRGLDVDAVVAKLGRLRASGIRTCAVALMHSWINPAHEQALAALLRHHGFEHVSCSSEMGAAIKYLPRAETAVVDAYLSPVIGSYLSGVARALSEGSTLHAMTSSGGLVGAASFRAKDSLLSGPAGGVVGAAEAARRSGFGRLISFDMGGTSTDVARFDGDHSYVFEHQVGDAHIVAPAVAVESVAAGGGSVCWLDETGGGVLRVGPMSAGANPGPACYGAGGPLTITDANLLLGRLDEGWFEIPIAVDAARARAEELQRQLREVRGDAPDLNELLEGLIELADERMAQAIRTISISKGFDPAEHVLVAFGGAGGQHGCAVAARLGMGRVLIPQDVGLLSAAGLGAAAIERFAQRQVLKPLSAAMDTLHEVVGQLARSAAREVEREGVAPSEVMIRRRMINLRLAGQDASISIEMKQGATISELGAAFAGAYRGLYGYVPRGREIEVESVRVVAASAGLREASNSVPRIESYEPPAARRAQVWFGGEFHDGGEFERSALSPGAVIKGPALIVEAHGTTVVAPGWTARVDGAEAIVLEGLGTGLERAGSSGAVRDELLIARLTSVAAEMGETLRATALSTNVKERLDYSCAILDADAQLVINAPHIPVHLGALGLSVRMLRGAIAMGPGDVVVTNHPAFGGSHLPDITVVTPVFDGAGTLLAYVASRAHHAEIGGTRPGSMPPGARTLAEEGVVIPPMYLVKTGVSRVDEFRAVMTRGPWPTRQVEDNVADIQAQIAANHRGAAAIATMAALEGAAELARTMSMLTGRANERAVAALKRFAGQRLAAAEELDDGSPIRVSIAVTNAGRATVDFTGSAPVHPGNFNAPVGVIRSAVMYVLRLLIDQPLPLNEGILRAIDLVVPEGMLNPPFDSDPERCPAVAAGNCETSQRVVDTLIKAIGLASCSQGTMNNLIFGNARFGYYETICGGSGAGPGLDGAAVVHTHMTNTRITDPEVLEQRYPVRLDRFTIRRGSGGAGKYRGGDGAVREYTFLEPVSISLLTQHRTNGPYGTEGGLAGQPGRQTIFISGSPPRELGPVEAIDLPKGERLVIETPGGGGWGLAPPRVE